MKIVVTGATGHIGINMVKRLTQEGFEVIALYRSKGKIEKIDQFGAKWVRGDVLDRSFLENVFKGADVVVNLAARISISGDPTGEVMSTNIQGPANVVSACLENDVRKLIHFSSIHAFKFSGKDKVVNEDTGKADETCFVYDRSKAGGELEIQKGVAAGLSAVILNPTGVLGPYNYFNSFTGQMLKDLYNGRIPALVKAAYNWVDARDLAEATFQAIENGENGANYILAGHNMDVRTIAQLVHKSGGKKSPRISVGMGLAKFGLPFLTLYSRLFNTPPLYTNESLDVLENYNPNISNARAKKDLNFTPRPLEDTISDSIAWYRSNDLL